MKKSLRLAILVLSLALIFCAISVIANAETETASEPAVFDQNTINNSDGTINFTSDMKISATMSVKKNITINLNGHKLIMNPTNYFSYGGKYTLTINGPGEIECGLIALCWDSSNGAILNLNGGSGDGLYIHQSASNVQFTKMKYGYINIDNVKYYSDSPWSGNAELGVFDTENSTYGVAFNFTNSTFDIPYASNFSAAGPTVDGNVPLSSHNFFAQIRGSNGSMTMDNCVVRHDGNIFGLFSNGTSNTGVIIDVNNSTLDAYTKAAAGRNFLIYAGTDYNASGICQFKNSSIGSDYGLTSGYSTGASASDPLILKAYNCTLSNYGTRGTGDNANLTANSDIYLYDGCRILTVTNSTAGRQGNGFITLGTRANRTIERTYTLLIDNEGTIISTDYSGDGVSTRYSDSTPDYQWVYDPIGDSQCPYVAVATSEAAPSSAFTKTTKSIIQNFEGMNIEITDAGYSVNKTDFRYSTYDDEGILNKSTTVSTSNDPISTYWYNQRGNFSLVKTTKNSYLKWYVPQNPANPSQTKAPYSGSYPNLSPSPIGSNFTAVSTEVVPTYQVAVYEMSIGTETQLPTGLSFYIHSRNESRTITNADGTTKTINSGTASRGGWRISGNRLVANGAVRTGDASLELDLNKWNHITAVIYFDPTYGTAQTYGYGIIYWYLNGEQIGYTDGISSAQHIDYTVAGFRMDLNNFNFTIGDSIVFDNLNARFYEATIGDGETIGTKGGAKGVHTPDVYVSPAESTVKPYVVPSVNVGGADYYTVNDAAEAAKDTDFRINLLRDNKDLVIVDEKTEIYTNGHTFTPAAGSASPFRDYGGAADGFSTYAPDGEADVDASGNPIITIDPSKKVPYGYLNGNPSNESHVEDNSRYEGLSYVYVGVAPTADYDLIMGNGYLVKEGQALYSAAQTGWINPTTATATAAAATEADYYNYYKNGDVIRFVAEFGDKTAITANVVIVTRDGFIRKTVSHGTGATDGFWAGNADTGSGLWGWKLAYGETVILNKNTQFLGSFSPSGADPNTPREERTISFDLNGYTLKFDSTVGGTDSQIGFNAYIGDTFNLYSSVPGGKYLTYGVSQTTNADGTRVPVNDSYVVVNVTSSYTAADLINSYGTDYQLYHEHTQNGDVEELSTEVNIGTATDYNGVTHSGSNISEIHCDGLVNVHYGDRNAKINVEGVTIYKNSHCEPIIVVNGFNGKLNVKDVDVRSSAATEAESKALIYAINNFYVSDHVRSKPTVTVDNVTHYSGVSGMPLFVGENNLGYVNITNFTSNGLIAGENRNLNTIVLGENVGAYFTTDDSDDGFVKLEKGLRTLPYGASVSGITVDLLTFTESKFVNNDGSYTFAHSEKTLSGVVIPYLTAASGATVTVNGVGGESLSREYAIGGVVRIEDFEAVLKDYNGSAIKATFDGTFDGKTVFPFNAENDVTYTADVTKAACIGNIYTNLSLYSSFGVNIYIPKAYEGGIERITLDGEEISLSAIETTVIGGADYYLITSTRNASEIGRDVTAVLTLSENGYTLDSTVQISVINYTDSIINGDYTDEEKALMKYIISYAKIINDYVSEPDEAVDAAYDKIGTLDGFGKSYGEIDPSNSNKLHSAFKSATVTLEGAAPAFRFTVSDTFSGEVTVNGKTYAVTPGQQIIISDIKAHSFLSDISVVIGEKTATYNFGNYAAYAYGRNEPLSKVIDAIWDYCSAASEFSSLPKYTVTLDSDGGSAPTSISVVQNTKMPAITPVREGYTFLGWYNGNQWWSMAKNTVTSDMTLVARWEVNSYEVSFDAKGGEADTTPLTVSYGDTVTLPEATFGARTFLGWYDGDTLVTDGAWSIARDVTLTAKWELSPELAAKFTIAGKPLSSFDLVIDIDGMEDIYNGNIVKFAYDLSVCTGIELAEAESAAAGNNDFIIRYVTDAGDDGFRAYYDGEDFIVECSYYNVFDMKFGEFADKVFLNNRDGITIGEDYTDDIAANVLYYSEFGAVGDGVADDFVAIYNTHVAANQCGQKVMGDIGARYYVHVFSKTIPIMTNVDWNGATFIVDDTGDEVYNNRGTHLFTLTTTAKTRTLSESVIKKIAESGTDIELHAGDTSIGWLADYIDTVSFVTIKNNHKDYIRHGANTSSGYNREDILIINPNGTLNEDTPLIWDFVSGEQYIHNWAGTKFKADASGNATWFGAKIHKVSAITSVRIVEADDEPIVVENGLFERIVCRTVAATNFENVYAAYSRGIQIRRCNSTVKNITHHNLDEPEFPKIANSTGEESGTTQWMNYYGVDTTKGNNGLITDDAGKRYFIGQSYPYGGMISFSGTYNSRLVDSFLSGRTVYYEAKTTSGTPIPMGSYDLHIYGSSHVYIENVQQLNDINDTHYWGIMNSNRAKNLFFTDSSLSRFDAHEGFWNGTFTNTTFGRYINVIGGGHLRIENCTRNVGQNFISLRGDYGATFNGTIEIIDSTMMGWKEFRRTQQEGNNRYYPASTELYVINSGYSSVYKEYVNSDGDTVTPYTKNNASTFPYLKWDFGYTCYMPQNVIIDNFTNANINRATVYLYNYVGDACFVKPDNFVQSVDYANQKVTLADGTTRNMTAADVYYNQYQITKSLTFRNMDKLPICPSSSSYLYTTLDAIAKVE